MKKVKLIKLHFIVSITLFLFFSTGCQKESTSPPMPGVITAKFALAGLEYVNLTPGKYLIYKDSANGTLDSVVIAKSLLETKYTPADTVVQGGVPVSYPAIYSQEFSLTLTKIDDTSQTAWFTGSATTELPLVGNITNENLRLLEIYHLSGTATEYVNSFAFFYSSQNPGSNIIPSIAIEGKNYTNVIFTATESLSDVYDPEYTKRTFYWAKGIGIIKREIITAGGAIQTQTLLRNN